jgi:hypothetical protein
MNIDDLYPDNGEREEVSQPNEMFVSLVRNAIDFLKKSVDELEDSPKYSVELSASRSILQTHPSYRLNPRF